MDRDSAILASLPGLEARLRHAGFDQWLEEQPSIDVGGQRLFLVGGDQQKSEAQMMLDYARQHNLVEPADLAAAEARQPLEPDVEAVEIGDEEQGDL